MRDYFNKCKWTMLTTSLLILLPIVAGVILWDKLPEKIPCHWGINGEVDGWASKPMAVFLLPCILLGVQWLCFLATGLDPKRRNIPPKVMGIVLSIIPSLNLVLHVLVYLYAFDYKVDVAVTLSVLFGVMFVIIGNYLPKCKQSYTLGIKLPWTLHDEENWNATHRLAGKLWVAGGLLTMLCALLPAVATFIVMMVILLVMCAVPTVYSYLYYKKHKTEE